MKFCLFVFATLFSVLCFAEAKKISLNRVETSLKSQALAEAKVEGLAKESATDARVSGMLTLKDPRPEIITRTWSYFAGFTAQSFQAQGATTKEGAGTFDLGKLNSTVMPGLELGIISPALQTRSLLWKLGLRAEGGFASQATSVTLNSGYLIDDARLNTTIFSGGLLLTLQWDRLQWLSFTFSPQLGTVNYTQTSANEFAAFSKQGAFNSWSFGLDFALNKKWSVFTEWTQRDLKDTTEIALQKDNFELGTKITW